MVLEIESAKSMCWQDFALFKATKEDSSLLLSALVVPGAPWFVVLR